MSSELLERLRGAGLYGSDAAKNWLGAIDGKPTRELRLHKKGDAHQGHRHKTDHYTHIVCGSVSVEVDGVTSEHRAGDVIFIAKDKWHRFTALEDETSYRCVFESTGSSEPWDYQHFFDDAEALEKIAACEGCNGCSIRA